MQKHTQHLREQRRFILALQQEAGASGPPDALVVAWEAQHHACCGAQIRHATEGDPVALQHVRRCLRLPDHAPFPQPYTPGQKPPTVHDTVVCPQCGQRWTTTALAPILDDRQYVQPGDVVPLGQCPNVTCSALCYPPYGYVYTLQQQLTTTRQHCTALADVVAQLLAWAQHMGGWDAQVWTHARRVLRRTANDASRQ